MLSVGTLNINTGHGTKGNFRQVMTRSLLEYNLKRVAELLRDAQLDVVCLQEVDFDWPGTCGVDQAQWIAAHAGYPHVHAFAHHVPLPGARRILRKDDVIFTRKTGTAILSRFPIASRGSYTFGQTLTWNPLANHFAKLLNESKGYTFAELDVRGQRIGVVNVHLLNDIVYEIFRAIGRQVRGEIFARAWQVEKLLEHVRERHATGLPLIVAGDFNTVPREDTLHHTHSKNGDPDDYRRDISMVLVREARVLETIPELFGAGSPETIRNYHTYPGVEPDRTLDYIFTTRELAFLKYDVLLPPVSDHLLVMARLGLEEEEREAEFATERLRVVGEI